MSAGDEKDQAITIVGDSLLQFGDDQHETLLLCSPSQLPTTDVALQTLRELDEHEKNQKEQVFQEESKLEALVMYICIYFCIKISICMSSLIIYEHILYTLYAYKACTYIYKVYIIRYMHSIHNHEVHCIEINTIPHVSKQAPGRLQRLLLTRTPLILWSFLSMRPSPGESSSG